MFKRFLGLVAILIVLGLLAACASPTPTPAPSPTPKPAAPTSVASPTKPAALTPAASSAPQITIEGAWGRQSPKMAAAGAFYMTIRNTGAVADKLIAAKSPGCGTVELHESYKMPDGTMGMRMVTGGAIEIPANGQVELKVGGLHIMCIDKKVEFKAGVKVPLTLVFEKSGEKTLEIEIREQ